MIGIVSRKVSFLSRRFDFPLQASRVILPKTQQLFPMINEECVS
jgi:hypothetical protein